MKHLFPISLLLLYLNMGCDKVEPPIQPQFAPQVSAGDDFYVIYPIDTTSLNGSFTKTQYEILQHSWRKIAGPSSYEIEQPQSLKTKVSNLVKGRYGFELTVTDKAGLAAKDSVYFSVVSVYKEDTSKKEVNFNNQRWEWLIGGFPYFIIENFQSFVPTGSAFKVYIKRDNETPWVEVENSGRETDEYVWNIQNANSELRIQVNHFAILNDTPDVKIVY